MFPSIFIKYSEMFPYISVRYSETFPHISVEYSEMYLRVSEMLLDSSKILEYISYTFVYATNMFVYIS